MEEGEYSKGNGESSLNVLVTGGSRGIGSKIVSTFASNKHNVLINYNNSEESAKDLSKDLNSKGFSTTIFKSDVSDIDQVNSMVDFFNKTYGSVDVLVNNAGIAKSQLFNEITIKFTYIRSCAV